MLVTYIAEEYKKESGSDIRKNPQSLQRLIEAAEKAKIELSSTTQTVVSLPFIGMNPVTNTPLNLEMTITRGKFEELIQPLLKKIRGPVEQALRDAGLPANKIDEVLLVGGSTRVPAVQQIVKDMLGQEPNRTVNPDEVVALGAAVQAGVLTGTVEDVVLLDVTPLSLSVETKGGVATALIPRNTTVPTRKSEIFTTAEHNQPSVEIHILQGERSMAMDNKSLGRFRLEGIPAMMAGMPQIEVTFDIDANGILHASAKEKSTGKEQSITIQNTTTLSDQEIDRMVKDAEANAEADRKRKEHVELKNTLDSARIRAEQVLQEKQSSPEAKSSLEAAVARAKDLIGRESGDEDLRSATEQLMQALQMYEQGATQAPADSSAGASANKPDDVIDADFKPAD
jgi:molecular chaperone DnaK